MRDAHLRTVEVREPAGRPLYRQRWFLLWLALSLGWSVGVLWVLR